MITGTTDHSPAPHEILGLEASIEESARRDYVTRTFARVFELEHDGNIGWSHIDDNTLQAEEILPNIDGTDIVVPVLFYRTMPEYSAGWDYFLHLGDVHGPCRNEMDIRVAELAQKLFDDSGPAAVHARIAAAKEREAEAAHGPEQQGGVSRIIARLLGR